MRVEAGEERKGGRERKAEFILAIFQNRYFVAGMHKGICQFKYGCCRRNIQVWACKNAGIQCG